MAGDTIRVDSVGDLLRDVSRDLADAFDGVPIPGAFRYAVDLGAPGGGAHGAAAVLEPPRGRTAMLVGPGILERRAVDGLRAFAAAAHVGVANTWGAKGVFPWDSPHHLGTCGLQARDFELLGFADLELLWVSGLDEHESPRARFDLGAPVAAIAPDDLGTFATRVARSSYPIDRPPLFERLAAVAQPGYVDQRVPRHPARAVMDLKQGLAPGALVTAEPGPAGLWVARTFPTDAPGTVVVPAVAAPGVAVALGFAAARAGRTTTAVTVAPLDERTGAIAALAKERALPLTLEVWGEDVDLSLTDLLVEAAGRVVAWGP
jgi:thiamine pyrophosphate-dependent acetolactate synthase large subunit-like protein